MKPKSLIAWLGTWGVSLYFGSQTVWAAGDGALPATPGATAAQNMLPPGAVQEGAVVLHKVASDKENLHLLAGYYYGNARLWQKIYAANRKLIKNPNRLPVGQTLRIQVGEGWQPKFAYQEWFNLALRNGEWTSGKARPKTPAASTPAAAAQEAPSVEVPQAAPTPEKTAPAEIVKTPAETPKKAALAQPTPAPTAAATPAKESPAPPAAATPAQAAPPKESPPQATPTPKLAW